MLNQAQCDKAFPELFHDIERAVKDRNGKQITKEEIDGIEPKNGYVRGMIYDQQVCLSKRHELYEPGLSQLQLTHLLPALCNPHRR